MKYLKTLWMLIVAALACPDTFCFGAVKISSSEYSFNDLLNAIATVESNNNPNAVGDGGKAVGAYQIHNIYVDDVNRILGQPHFSYKDRWSAYKSRLMVGVYLRHYGKNKTLKEMAAIHVAGPQGWKKLKKSKEIQKYVEKVFEAIEK